MKEVSTVLILFQGPLRGTANFGEALRVVFTAHRKEGNRNLESVSFESGVRNDSCGGWIRR